MSHYVFIKSVLTHCALIFRYSLSRTLADLELEIGPSTALPLNARRIFAAKASHSPSSRPSPQREAAEGQIFMQSNYDEIRENIETKEKAKRDYQYKARLSFQSRQFAVASYYGEEARKIQNKIDILSKEIVIAHQQSL